MATHTQNNSQPQSQAIERVNNFKMVLQEDYVQSQLKNALADNAAAFAASLVELYSGDKNLMECDPKRVVMEALKAAVIQLPINRSLGFAWIVPYKGVPQFQIGYKGLIQLAIRTGQYKHINAGPVFEGEYKTANKLTGEFDLTGTAKSETVIGYFAHFELKNGFSKTLYMTKEKVTAHAAKYSKSYSYAGSPWKTEFDSMATKTVLTSLLKHWGYLSVEMITAIENDVDQDEADKVMQEIRGNANRRDMGFQEAEVVAEQSAEAAAGANSNGQIPF
jgi:recombination protein RecT